MIPEVMIPDLAIPDVVIVGVIAATNYPSRVLAALKNHSAFAHCFALHKTLRTERKLITERHAIDANR